MNKINKTNYNSIDHVRNTYLNNKNKKANNKDIKESNQPFSVVVSGHGYAFWKDALQRDLLRPLREIDATVVVVQTTADKSVDPKQTQQEIKRIIAEGATNVTLEMIPGLDHGFRDESGTSRLREVVGAIASAIDGET